MTLLIAVDRADGKTILGTADTYREVNDLTGSSEEGSDIIYYYATPALFQAASADLDVSWVFQDDTKLTACLPGEEHN
jgi:hypothetical protein